MADINKVFVSLRLNTQNPEHIRIQEVLTNLNPDVYKSKNQFLTEALLFYIDHYGEETFMEKPEPDKRYVLSDEIETIKEEIMQEARETARNEAARLLGGVISGMQQTRSDVWVKGSEKREENLPDDDIISGCALSWMQADNTDDI